MTRYLPILLLIAVSAGAVENSEKDVAAEFRAAVARNTATPAASRIFTKALKTLDPKKGKGWVIVKTTSLFPEPLMKRFYEAVTQLSQVDAEASKMLKEIGEDETSVRTLTPEQVAPLQDYAQWVAKQLNANLGKDEQLEVAHLDVRVTSAAGGGAPGSWHLDQEYLTANIVLFGEGQEILPNTPKLNAETFPKYKKKADRRSKDKVRAGRGETMIFSGLDRAAAFKNVRPTVHRGAAVQNRLFLVMRFARIGGAAAPSPKPAEKN